MKIFKIGTALKERQQMESDLSALINELNRSSHYDYTPIEKQNGTIVKPNREPEDIFADIDKLEKNIRLISKAITIGNISAIVTLPCGETMSMLEALSELGQMKGKLRSLNSMAESEKITRRIMSYDTIQYKEVNYDIEDIKNRRDLLRQRITDIQGGIDDVNREFSIEVEIIE